MPITTLVKQFERLIVFIVLLLLAVVILLTTVDLVRQIVLQILASPLFILETDRLLEIFGLVLLILIGVELVETVKLYFLEHVVHVEVVLEVALIALARKIIVMNVKDYEPATLFAIAALVVALAIGYYVEKRMQAHDRNGEKHP